MLREYPGRGNHDRSHRRLSRRERGRLRCGRSLHSESGVSQMPLPLFIRRAAADAAARWEQVPSEVAAVRASQRLLDAEEWGDATISRSHWSVASVRAYSSRGSRQRRHPTRAQNPRQRDGRGGERRPRGAGCRAPGSTLRIDQALHAGVAMGRVARAERRVSRAEELPSRAGDRARFKRFERALNFRRCSNSTSE